MQMRKLGRSGLAVSRLCYGTLTMSPLQKDLSPEDGARLLVHAYERGVRFLDTAEAKRLVVQMGYMYRYNPAVQRVFEAVRNGELGSI